MPVEDLWRWDQALYGTRLLPAATLATAFAAHMPTSDQPGSGYGYGWYVASHGGARKLWHYGETNRVQHLSRPLPGRAAHDHHARIAGVILAAP